MTHPLVPTLRKALLQARNDAKGREMSAYMKHVQPFYGVSSGERRQIFRKAIRSHPISTPEAYQSAILALWRGHYREERYMALEIAERVKKYRERSSWDLYSGLIHSADWWDTLDWLAGRIISPMVLEVPGLKKDLISWRSSAHLWTRRASLLAHLKHKSQTDTALLAETILILAPEQVFFIRKAIGWILREYSKSDPQWVLDFVKHHDTSLSELSKREALKVIQRQRDF